MSYKDYKLNFNGINLDNEIKGYITTNVYNRNVYSKEIDIVEIPGNDQVFILSENRKNDPLIVEYLIIADNDKEYREILRKLNLLLDSKNKDVKFSFSGEDGYRIGRVVEIKEPKANKNKGIGTFTIQLVNPYLYMSEKTSLESNQTTIIYPGVSKIEWLEFKIKPNQRNIKIINMRSGEVISLIDLESIDEIIITKDSILQNKKNIANKLDINTSVWKSFEIKHQDILQFQNCTATTKFRGLY